MFFSCNSMTGVRWRFPVSEIFACPPIGPFAIEIWPTAVYREEFYPAKKQSFWQAFQTVNSMIFDSFSDL